MIVHQPLPPNSCHPPPSFVWWRTNQNCRTVFHCLISIFFFFIFSLFLFSIYYEFFCMLSNSVCSRYYTSRVVFFNPLPFYVLLDFFVFIFKNPYRLLFKISIFIFKMFCHMIWELSLCNGARHKFILYSTFYNKTFLRVILIRTMCCLVFIINFIFTIFWAANPAILRWLVNAILYESNKWYFQTVGNKGYTSTVT